MALEIDKKPVHYPSLFVVSLILGAFWLILSGHYDPFHLGLGFICSLLVAVASHDLLIRRAARQKMLKSWRFLHYAPWLLYQVVLANFHVVSLVINPRKIRPQVLRFKSKLKSDVAMVSFGNSITLTPGTITMDIDEGEFYVHALSDKAARDLMSGEMERRIAHVFLESEPGDDS